MQIASTAQVVITMIWEVEKIFLEKEIEIEKNCSFFNGISHVISFTFSDKK